MDAPTFSLSRENMDTWPTLDVLPPELHPATINPADYFGKIPSTGKYNLLDNGLPESFGTNDDAAKKYAALDTLPESNKYMGKYIGDSIQKASGLAKTQLVVRVMIATDMWTLMLELQTQLRSSTASTTVKNSSP